MTRKGRLAGSMLSIAVVSLVAAGCSGTDSPRNTAYSFHTGDSAIKVDTPELRALKASAGIAPCPTVSSTPTDVEGGLPALTLPCLGGGPNVDLADLRGPLLLNFWAQTCTPCQEESPLLEQLASSARGKVRVIGVDFIDPLPGKALAFAKDYGLTYPQIADPVGAAKAPLRISGLPFTFFVDRAGKVTYIQIGAITSQSQLASLVHDHLGVTVPAGTGS
jgi:cytochrome c biogenesis protein CcmG/thiol:disulfide interchange protein DsbE